MLKSFSRKQIEAAVKTLVIGVIAIFFILYLRDIDYALLRDIQIMWPPLVLASLISLAFRYWGVVIWRYILKDLGARSLPPFVVLSDVYAKAWMGRYIPGTVTWIAGKIYLANKHGISKSRLAVSSLLEGGMQIVAIMAVSMLILGLDPRLDVIPMTTKATILAIGCSLLVLLFPPIFNRVLGFAHQLIKKKPAGKELQVNGRAITRAFTLYATGTLIMGSSYYFLTASLVTQVTPDMFLYFVGAFSLSGAIGMAVPFLPSGLGVREGVQLVLLSVIFPKEIALVITIFSRLWSAVVDVLFYAFSNLAVRVIGNKRGE